MRVYVATSWKNAHQPTVVSYLREAGHEVYDFRHPTPGNDGFHWSSVSDRWPSWTVLEYLEALDHPSACAGFRLDMDALRWCEACVLVLPCGRSAHLEAGWAVGAGRQLIIYLTEFDTPELMYRMAGTIVSRLPAVVMALSASSTTAENLSRGSADRSPLDHVRDVTKMMPPRLT